MVRTKNTRNINEGKKFVIGYLYQNTDLSIYKIARILKVSNQTVFNYKDFNVGFIPKPGPIKHGAAATTKKQIITKLKSELTYPMIIQEIINEFEKLDPIQRNPIKLSNMVYKKYWKKYYNFLMYDTDSPFKSQNRLEASVPDEIKHKFYLDVKEKVTFYNPENNKVESPIEKTPIESPIKTDYKKELFQRIYSVYLEKYSGINDPINFICDHVQKEFDLLKKFYYSDKTDLRYFIIDVCNYNKKKGNTTENLEIIESTKF